MPRTPQPKPDDPEQSKRFIEIARKLGTKDDPRSFDRAFHKVATAPRTPPKAKKKSR